MNRYLIVYSILKNGVNEIHNDIVEWNLLTETNITYYMFEDENNPKKIINIIKLDLEPAWK